MCTVYRVYSLYNLSCTVLYSLVCTMYSFVQCTDPSPAVRQSGAGLWDDQSLTRYTDLPLHSTVCTVHCTVHTLHCAIHTVHCSLFTVQCWIGPASGWSDWQSGPCHCTLKLQCTAHYIFTALHCTLKLHCTVVNCTATL